MFITNDAYLVLVGDGNADRFYVKAGSDFGVFNSVTVDATAILNWTATLAGNRLHEIAAISGVGAVGSMAYQLGDGLGAGGDETYWRLEAFEVPYTQGGSF
jgi:hypothetical protein